MSIKKPGWLAATSEGFMSSSTLNIGQRLEECLIYARNKEKTYTDAHDLALDYGKYGTSKFFPLPLLVGLVRKDERFKPYLVKLQDNNVARMDDFR
jgi:hypothetical protein